VAASQPAASFAFWCAWLLVFRAVASWAWAPLPSWPGRWLLLPAGLSAWGTAWALGPGRAVRRFRLPVAGLPAPLRLVHVSDLHFGLNAPARRVRRLVERVRRLGPDLVALTGDLITPFSETTWTPLVPLLADLCVPVLVCPGNHDRAIAHRMGPALEAAGLTWLADRTATLDVKGVRVEAVGLDFRYRGIRAHVLSTLPSLPPGPADLRLLLCHDPRCLRSVPGGRFHLALAGHLHGGPVAGDFLGLQGSPVRWTGTPDHGLFRRGTTLAHVSSGNVDVTFPPRLGSASEIAVIELVPA
jgi:predicted MPP superfamily phosphohydrolase